MSADALATHVARALAVTIWAWIDQSYLDPAPQELMTGSPGKNYGYLPDKIM